MPRQTDVKRTVWEFELLPGEIGGWAARFYATTVTFGEDGLVMFYEDSSPSVPIAVVHLAPGQILRRREALTGETELTETI